MADAAAIALVAILVGTTSVMVERLVGVEQALDRGFQLATDRRYGITSAEYASLEHPVPPGTRANQPPTDVPGALRAASWWPEDAFRTGRGR